MATAAIRNADVLHYFGEFRDRVAAAPAIPVLTDATSVVLPLIGLALLVDRRTGELGERESREETCEIDMPTTNYVRA
jgi:hypothetical protein